MAKLRTLLLTWGAVGALFSASAQDGADPPPRLTVQREGKEEPLRVVRVDVDARIHGAFAETRMTLTFANPHSRDLAGQLTFPLPEGSTVSGYGLDIQGRLVDGVIVDKDRGRRILEKEIRRNVDPGLMEHVAGNAFRTRVYPVPANGTRTVMVRYVAELDVDGKGCTYRLPLGFPGKVDRFRARLEVVSEFGKPVVMEGGPVELDFKTWRRSHVAECKRDDAVLNAPLKVRVPADTGTMVAVERREQTALFAIRHLAAPPSAADTAHFTAPRVTVFWDASGSRNAADIEKELHFLGAVLKRAGPGVVTVKPIVVRNDVESLPLQSVRGGDVAKLVEMLRSAPRDGGTVLAGISPELAADSDFCLVFSDGLSTFGPAFPAAMPVPCMVVSSSATADHNALKGFAARTGGQFVNLARTPVAEAAARVSRGAPYQFLFATVNGKRSNACFPSIPQPVGGPLSVIGTFDGKDADVVLHFGRDGKSEKTETVRVESAATRDGDLLWKLHGQAQVAEGQQLGTDPEEFIWLGKEYGLVTPRTSLLVLETLDQYVEHRVTPPAALPKLREQYLGRMAKEAKAKGDRAGERLDAVAAKWRKLCKWYDHEFKWDGRKVRPGKRAAPRTAAGFVVLGAASLDAPMEAEAGAADMDEAGDPFAAPAAAPRPAAAAPQAIASRVALREVAVPEAPESAVDDPFGGGASAAASAAAITVKPWDPKTPYLAKLKKARLPYGEYLEIRKDYMASPSFFLDCANFFFKKGDTVCGVRVLSNLAEMDLENPALLRVLAHRLAQVQQIDDAERMFRKVLDLRPEEPQSHRDLALVLGRLAKYEEAARLLYTVVIGEWDRFEDIELIALVELNNLLARAVRAGKRVPHTFDRRLMRNLELDTRVAMTWDADLTDMDLWVHEPSGEKCVYDNNRTVIGGRLSRDFTQGYGPEEYLLRRAPGGDYRVEVNYYGSRAQRLFGPVTVQAEIFTNYGRPSETRQTLTVRLEKEKGVVPLGTVDVKGNKLTPVPGDEKPSAPGVAELGPRPQTYRVQPGDTLTAIARRFYDDPSKWRAIYEANPQLEDFNMLRAGAELRLP